uniref:Ribosomal RNA large subunit methyltransferase K/L-like methyltransferase domain-containing protein n=1 Tax=Timema bartmani TaxID=61472 RepID=A0A7R9I160_9NEOP|nr:unnamed protein product [Timema bartmani]
MADAVTCTPERLILNRLKSLNWKVELREPDIEVYVHANNEHLTIGFPITRKPLSQRCYIKHIMLRSTICHAMLMSVGGFDPHSILLDPMCGAATLLVEAATSFPNITLIGIDIDNAQLKYAQENITSANSNACSLPLKHETVSYIVCDLPFGLKFGSTESVKKLLPSVLLEMDKVLVPKGRVMSDTDDTDVLLLIPPDFFNVIPSDSEDSFLYHGSTSYHGDRSEVERIVVNDLIDQVNELESRICFIETSDQHYESGEFTTLPNSEEIIVRSSKLTPEMYRSSFNQRRLELRDVDQLLDQMEATQLEIVQKLQGSGIPVIQDKDLKRNTKISVQKVANTGENISSVPNLGFGVRELFVGHSTPPSPQKLKGYDTRQPVEEDPIVPKTISPLGSDQISKRKTQDFGTEGQKKKGTYSMDVKKEKLPPSTNVDLIVTQQRDTREGSTAIGSSGTHCKQDLKTSLLDEGYLTAAGPGQGSGTLLSLSELWGEQELAPVFFQDRGDHANLASRLEEERYRRQHCEHLIVDLQGQLLQEHQKLAVAVKVDTAKDHAIARLQSAWTQLVQHWRELEEQRNNLANTLHLEREQYQQEMINASKKVSRLEGELSQALDLAHGYKEKSESSERERQEMIDLHMAETEALTAQLQEMRQHLDEANTEHSRIIGAKEETEARLVASQQEVGKILSERSMKENVRKELQKIKQTLSNCEVELLALKEEKASLQLKMKEERNRISVVDQQKRSLQTTLDETKKREVGKSLRDELKASNDRLEKVKVDLRDYYQREVEVVVRTKLAEFQGQLDSAEASLRQELEAREKVVTEIAQKQVKQIADKNELAAKEAVHLPPEASLVVMFLDLKSCVRRWFLCT